MECRVDVARAMDAELSDGDCRSLARISLTPLRREDREALRGQVKREDLAAVESDDGRLCDDQPQCRLLQCRTNHARQGVLQWGPEPRPEGRRRRSPTPLKNGENGAEVEIPT